MILKSIEPRNFGPFAVPAEIEFEPDVTVLTGPNDTGKSSLLRLIDLICRDKSDPKRLASERDVNFDHIHEAKAGWGEDPSIGCRATFVPTKFTPQYIPEARTWAAPQVLDFDLEFVLAPGVWRRTGASYRSEGARGHTQVSVSKMPLVIRLPLEHEVRDVVDLTNPNPTEKSLLRTAFGPEFSFAQLQSLSHPIFTRQLARAQGRLNRELRTMLPSALGLEFHLQAGPERPQQLSVSIADKHEGYTPFGSRGAGVRKTVSIMGALMETDLSSQHVYILFDEPENSLHADAQHMLRTLLEELAKRETVQVIYATHSPSMINTMRPQSIRLFQRTQKDGKATSVVENRPIHENYLRVRSSLGISPADSLLYAPVTVIVEGVTEVVALPLILRKFKEGGVPGFEDVDKLLSQVHFLAGEGDSFEYMCRLAKSQGARPIIFLDGDKVRRAQDVKTKHPDVPIITLDSNKELEQLLPEDIYFGAVSETLEHPKEDVSADAFRRWDEGADLPAKMMFTKRVERWLQDKFDGACLDKARVMKRAVELAQAKKIDPKEFLELVREVNRLSSSKDSVHAT